MVSLGLSWDAQRLFPLVGAEIVDQIGKMFPVERPDRLALKGGQEPQFQTKPGLLSVLDLSGIEESLRRLVYLARHGRPTIGTGHMENGKVLLCLIFNVHPIAPATVPTLVMHIVAVDRPVAGFLMAAAQASEISIFIVRCHNTCAVAFWAFHLDAGGQGAVGTICKIGFINHSAHQFISSKIS